jgi:hypothetical protein
MEGIQALTLTASPYHLKAVSRWNNKNNESKNKQHESNHMIKINNLQYSFFGTICCNEKEKTSQLII